jgi:hypothetical protein
MKMKIVGLWKNTKSIKNDNYNDNFYYVKFVNIVKYC